MKTRNKLTGEQFDALVDSGESLKGHVNWEKAIKVVNVSMPVWMIQSLDKEAKRLGIDRQAVIKTWLAEKIDQKAAIKVG